MLLFTSECIIILFHADLFHFETHLYLAVIQERLIIKLSVTMNQEDLRQLANPDISRHYPEMRNNESMANLPINPFMYPPLMNGRQWQNSGSHPNMFMPNIFPNAYVGVNTLPAHHMSSNPIFYYPMNNRSPPNFLPYYNQYTNTMPFLGVNGIPLFEHQPMNGRQPAVLQEIENRDEKSTHATNSAGVLKTETIEISSLLGPGRNENVMEVSGEPSVLSCYYRTRFFYE